jgi:two-component system cell cycle sensor histidine kinase/response regulator CckA
MDTNFFTAPVQLLHLEDSEIDRVLVQEMLAADGLMCEWKAVETRQEFRSALAHASFSLIISDFSLPSFDGMSALKVARELAPHTPFIFFSGTIGEEIAVESLKNGATDYILKQRPQRLVAAVRNALKAARERTRRLQAENELQKAQERFQIISRATNDVIWEWDIGANSIWVSDNFGIAFGHQTGKEGMHPDQWFDLIHPDDKSRVLAGISSLLASRGRVWWSEYRLRRADGTYTHIYDRASLIFDAAQKPKRLIGLKIDVSERKRAEEKIREQAELLDKAQDAIIVCTPDGKITFWNQGAERIYGWNREEALGKNIRELLFRGKSPWQMDDEAAKNPEASGEWMGELDGFTKSEQAVIVQTHTTLIRDEEGRTKSMLIISTDITEHKKLEEQFLRSQRLESLGVLVSGIAHDLNNTLVPIMIGIEVMQGEAQSENATAMLQTMKTSARRSADMIKQMLAFARGDDASKVVVQADRLVKEMTKIIGDTFPKSIQCRARVAQDSWPVLGLPTQLYQVLLNLCVNARDAMPNGGNLVLHTENAVISPERAEVIRGGKPGNYLCVTVSDTGTGIAPENLEKIFQPFFSTKAADKGTGLGLSTCQNIINSHNGFISVISQPGVGTEFKVYLPAAEVKAPPPVEAPALPTGQGECILVVDDEQSTLAIVRTALENYRYTVLTAASGAEAVGCFLKQPRAIQLVITDLAMPFMNGGETIDSLKKIRPDIKILVASGAEVEAGPLLEHIKNYPIIFKPFTNESLIKSVQSALGTAPTGAS